MVRLILIKTVIAFSVLSVLGSAIGGNYQPSLYQTQEAELVEADKLSVEVLNLFKLGEFEKALPLAKRALKIREKVLKPGDVRIADAQSNLAELHLALQHIDDAESLFKRAAKIYETDSTRNAKSLANTLDRMALLREFDQQPAKAEELYLRSIALREKVIGANHAETKEALDRLAAFYVRRKEYPKALTILRQQVSEGEKKQDEQFGKLLERVACILYKNKENAEAEKIEARANRILYADAAKKSEPLILGQENFDCRVINNPRPEFPRSAAGRFTGSITIVVAVEVSETGQVTNAQMVVGDPAFKRASEKAALTATVRPLSVDGQPVRFKGTITHAFSVMRTTGIVAVPGVGRP